MQEPGPYCAFAVESDMKLLYYEFRKLLAKPIFLVPAFLVAAVLLVRFYGVCRDLDWVDQDLYQEKRAEMERLPYEEAVARLSRDRDGLLVFGMLQLFGDSPEARELLEMQYSDIAAQYGMSFSEFADEYEAYAESSEEINQLQTVLSTLSQQYTYIDTYRAFIEEFPRRAEKMKSVSIFSEQTSFSNRSILKSLRDYSRLGAVEIRPDYDQGITAIGSDHTSIAFLLFLLLGAAVILFSEERDNGMIHMLRSTMRGHIPLALAKWGALALFSVIMVLLVYGGRILIARLVLGFGDPSRSLQSVSAFRNCCYRIRVDGYLLMHLLLPMLVVILFSVLLSFLFVFFQQPWITAGISAAIAGGQYLLYRFLSDQAALNVLKFMNVFSFADVEARFASNNYMNLFGYPVSVISGGIVSFLLLFGAGMTGTVFCFSKGLQLKLSLPLRSRRIIRISGSVRLISHELYRLYLGAFGILILSILIYLGYQKIEKEELMLSNKEYLYYSWGQEIAGEVTEETGEWLRKKEQELNEAVSPDLYSNTPADESEDVFDESEESGDANAASDIGEDRMAALLFAQMRSRELQEEREALLRIQQEYQMLQIPLSKGIPVHYISEVQTDPVTNHGKSYLLQALLMMAILSICFCPVFSMDEESGMGKLVHTSRKGRTVVFLTRYLVMILFYTITFVIFILPYLYNWIHVYRMTDWDAPLTSVIRYTNCEGKMTIRGFVVLWFIGSFISGFGYAALMGLLSKYCKKQSTTMVMAITLIASDFFANLFGFAGISTTVLSSGFGMTELLPRLGHTGWLYGVFAKNALLTAAILLWHWRVYVR